MDKRAFKLAIIGSGIQLAVDSLLLLTVIIVPQHYGYTVGDSLAGPVFGFFAVLDAIFFALLFTRRRWAVWFNVVYAGIHALPPVYGQLTSLIPLILLIIALRRTYKYPISVVIQPNPDQPSVGSTTT